MALLSSRVWDLQAPVNQHMIFKRFHPVVIPLAARETEGKGLSPLGQLHLINTTQSWKVALSRDSGYTARSEVLCQGLEGSTGLKSGRNCIMAMGGHGGGTRSGRGLEFRKPSISLEISASSPV